MLKSTPLSGSFGVSELSVSDVTICRTDFQNYMFVSDKVVEAQIGLEIKQYDTQENFSHQSLNSPIEAPCQHDWNWNRITVQPLLPTTHV